MTCLAHGVRDNEREAEMATINYAVKDNWGSGFVGNMTVAAGTTGLHGWTVEFDASFDITNIWGAEIVSRVGNHYVIRNAAWNADVGQGSSVTFGFQATPGAGGAMATGLTVNGSGSETPPPPVLPTISVADATITEGNNGTTQLAFTASLSQASAVPVTVQFATSNGSATAGQDYAAQTGIITFAPGETTKTVQVTVNGDAAVEANEALTLTLSGANGATIADGTATGTIVNDDVAPPPPPPTGSGANLDYAVGSNWGSGFTASMTVEAGTAALNGWTVEFDAAFSITNIWNAEIVSHVGNHYVVRGVSWNSLVAAGGEVAFGFQASGPTAATGFKINGVAADDTPPPAPLPTLVVADATVAEGDSGNQDLAFTVTLSAPSSSAVTVAYATGNGTASAGSDFVQASGMITFAPGETTKVVHVQVKGDTAVEANETVTLTLSAPQGATVTDSSAVGTITNDDVAPPPPVLPTISISDASVVEGDPGTGGGAPGWLSTSGNQIVDSAGHSVQIAGVNWFGFETGQMVPHGLWGARGYRDMMDQMVDLGFNTIRLPYSNDMLHATATSYNINYSKSPDLQGLTALQIMDKIIDYAGEIGLKIILDHHRSSAGDGASANGLWYDDQHSEAGWIADWQMLAARYADDPTIIGADLHNEPHNGAWGGGGANDWPAAAERAGNAIGEINPNWLIFVEGVGSYNGQPYWWGGNLMGVRDRPVELDVANKLVYSPHDYPNSVWAQPWFQGPDFPANLPAKFDEMWGYIFKEGIAPIYIGEFGTGLVDPKDAPWFEAITSYLAGDLNNDGASDLAAGQKGPGWTFWSWNPNSGDTGGILNNDWQTPNTAKLGYLTPIQYEFHDDAPGEGGAPGDANHASFLLTLSEPATQAVTVDYHTVTGTAGAGDFAGASGSVTFAVGEQSKTISIAITPDMLDENNEQFTVVLSNAQGATIARPTGTATIVDDDTAVTPPPPPPVEPPPADDGDLNALFAVVNSWSGGFNGSITVENDGAATSGWQVRIEMSHQITDIWNAVILSHDAQGYVVGNASWNGTIAHDGDTSFGFVASGPSSPSTVHVDLDV
jgi:aryl-phospho-beta-D-glucosidase BglC (GH1 family)/cellulase/cellobiase CelA1